MQTNAASTISSILAHGTINARTMQFIDEVQNREVDKKRLEFEQLKQETEAEKIRLELEQKRLFQTEERNARKKYARAKERNLAQEF